MQQSNMVHVRLEKIWQSPDFISFFEKSVKRPPHALKKGTILLNEGDPLERLYCITEGFVKLYRLSLEGRETTVYLFGPGNVLGLRALTSKDGCTKHIAEAITNVKVISMSKKEYFELLEIHPELLVDLAHMALERLDYTEKKLEGFIVANTHARIANFLLDIVNRFCEKKNGRIILPFELTHQRIAEFVGAFRETVTMSLHHLQAEKVLKVDRGKIEILNLKKLEGYVISLTKSS